VGDRKCPLSVAIIGWLFISACGVGLVYHFLPQHRGEMSGLTDIPQGWLWVFSIRLLGILGGVFLIRGRNWARWVLVGWMAFHVAVSALHSLSEVVVHSLLFGTILWLLFRAPISGYFRPASNASTRRSDAKT